MKKFDGSNLTFFHVSISQPQKLAEDGSPTKENIFQKEKKISFADEAGGMLCHVNVFEKGMASSETCPENQTLQAKEC